LIRHAHDPVRRSAWQRVIHRSSGAGVLDLIASGRKVADIARDLGVSGQTIYNWRAQDLVDRGDAPGLRSAELAELVAPKRRITSSRRSSPPPKRANELLKGAVRPKAVRGHRGHGRGGPRGAGLVPHPGGLRVRVLRPTLPCRAQKRWIGPVSRSFVEFPRPARLGGHDRDPDCPPGETPVSSTLSDDADRGVLPLGSGTRLISNRLNVLPMPHHRPRPARPQRINQERPLSPALWADFPSSENHLPAPDRLLHR
jgi:transposase